MDFLGTGAVQAREGGGKMDEARESPSNSVQLMREAHYKLLNALAENALAHHLTFTRKVSTDSRESDAILGEFAEDLQQVVQRWFPNLTPSATP